MKPLVPVSAGARVALGISFFVVFVGLWSLAVFLIAVHLGNLFGPPPPSVDAIVWAGHAQWLLVAAGYWVDRHRTATLSPR